MPPNLVYTIAVDPPGRHDYLTLAKMLVGSLLRCDFHCDIVVFTNGERPLYHIPRQRVYEIPINIENTPGVHFDNSTALKYLARHYFPAHRYDNILYIDADCLVLRALTPLFANSGLLGYVPEGWDISHEAFNAYLTAAEMQLKLPGINSGIFTVKGFAFDAIMARFECINNQLPLRAKGWSDQPAWNKVVLEYGHAAKAFDKATVAFPACWDPAVQQWSKAVVLHVCGEAMPPSNKAAVMFGMYAQRFYGDAAPVLMDLLEP
jgi:hypothetical protein